MTLSVKDAAGSTQSINTLPALGQATKAASLPVTLSSDQGNLSTIPSQATATGSITTQNLVPAGAATAGSAVEVTLAGANTLATQVTGTYTGALSLQVTIDGTNWKTVGGTPFIDLGTAGYLASITSALQSIFQSDVAGALKARVTALAAVTGTAVVTLLVSNSPALLALDTSLPAGTAIIGALSANQSCNVAQVAGVAPDMNAGAASANTLRVALATNSSANVAQIAGLAPDMNAGAASANTLRVALATNSSANVAQINAVAPLMGNGVTGTGSLRVTLASDNTANSNPFLVSGSAAHSAASTGNPVRVAGRVQTAVDTTLIAGDVSDLFMTSGGAITQKPYAIPEADWQFASATGGILNTTTAVTIKTAAAAGVRNYITGLQIQAEALGTATELAIRDGAAGTVIWRIKIGTAGLINGLSIEFPTPLKGTAATLLEVVTLTASTTGAVYVNAQGYTAP